MEYPRVYFAGIGAKKVRSKEASGVDNHGYDDDRGDYVMRTGDHLGYRFEIIDEAGKGSFGQVMRCYDHKTQRTVAVKVIRNKKRFHHQALVELKVLEHLRHKDPKDEHNLVKMREYFYFRNHLCITFELLSINLYDFLKNNNFRGLSLGLIRRFTQQILVSLKFLRRQRVIHCDLKPENILLRQPNKSSIKMIDFGSSCFDDERVYTYIQSRFYRAPEVILGATYDCGIDMWSLACILAELYTGYPLFPGENEAEQMACVMEINGVPPRSLLDRSERGKKYFESSGEPKLVANSKGKKRVPNSKDPRITAAVHGPRVHRLFIKVPSVGRRRTDHPVGRVATPVGARGGTRVANAVQPGHARAQVGHRFDLRIAEPATDGTIERGRDGAGGGEDDRTTDILGLIVLAVEMI